MEMVCNVYVIVTVAVGIIVTAAAQRLRAVVAVRSACITFNY